MGGNNIFILVIAGTLLLSLFAFFLVIYLQVQKRKQNRFRIEKEQLEQEILKSGIEIQEQAINTLSRELHDNIGSRLNAVMRFFHVMESAADKTTIEELRKDSIALLDDVIKDARNISHILSSDFVMNNGLIESVQKEADFVRKTTGINTLVLVDGDYHSLDTGHELIIFRMVQEAIANTIKYAKATNLHISLSYMEDFFELRISDNGIGFDTEGAGSGIGLANMKNRAKMLKANFSILSEKDNGTTLTLSLKTK